MSFDDSIDSDSISMRLLRVVALVDVVLVRVLAGTR